MVKSQPREGVRMRRSDSKDEGAVKGAPSRSRANPFVTQERRRQVVYFNGTHPNRIRYRNSEYRFAPEERDANLAPAIRAVAKTYFGKEITWHTHANHALSSQVCCLNFLMPIARDRAAVARFISAALRVETPTIETFEKSPGGQDWFIQFEWNGGGRDFLNESRKGEPLKRGSNSTSADAAIKFRSGGRTEILLIEWKYTEAYGAPIAAKGNATRTRRYADLAFAPGGPIKADAGLELADFFYEPFYQLLRQQMLAFQLEAKGEADRARVLHISPRGNRALHRVTSPKLRRFGGDAFEVFRQLLVLPERFVDRRTEELFGPLLDKASSDDPWATYLRQRYGFLGDPPNV
jgi:hypothetical protein